MPKCSTLAQALGPEYFAPNSSQYDASVMSYFTEQERLDPTCIVGPKSSQDVAKIVGMLANQSCHFAVRGGGHSLVVGAANIVDGVTIDLSAMNQVSLSADNTTASIGPGCRWRDVYDTLGPLGYAVPGGRAADVGVAGLTLGGGNSFFAAREGFVCDNVKNYEIVLGSGQIVNANNSTNSKLFTALKGGSNNFGVVTRFDIVAFAQGDIWGGVVVYPLSTAAAQIQAFVDFTNNIVNDQYSSLIGIWTYVAATAEETITNCYEYTKPQAFPPTFANLTGIQPNISSTMRISNLTDITNELESPANLRLVPASRGEQLGQVADGDRNSYNTVTFANNATIMTEVVNIVQQGLQPLKAHPDFIYWSYQFQPLPRIITDHSVAKGGNVLGLQRYPGNLICRPSNTS